MLILIILKINFNLFENAFYHLFYILAMINVVRYEPNGTATFVKSSKVIGTVNNLNWLSFSSCSNSSYIYWDVFNAYSIDSFVD